MNAFISNILRYFPHVRESSSGGSRVGARGARPLIFRPKWGPKGRKNFFGRRPPPPAPYMKVWIRHCLGQSWILDSTRDSVFRVLDSVFASGTKREWSSSFSLGGTWILDSSRLWDSRFLKLYWYSGFQIPGFQILRFSQILDFTSKNCLDSGIRIPFRQLTKLNLQTESKALKSVLTFLSYC